MHSRIARYGTIGVLYYSCTVLIDKEHTSDYTVLVHVVVGTMSSTTSIVLALLRTYEY